MCITKPSIVGKLFCSNNFYQSFLVGYARAQEKTHHPGQVDFLSGQITFKHNWLRKWSRKAKIQVFFKTVCEQMAIKWQVQVTHVHSFESDLFPIITVEPLLNSILGQIGRIKAQDSRQLGTSQSQNRCKRYLVDHLHNSVILRPRPKSSSLFLLYLNLVIPARIK